MKVALALLLSAVSAVAVTPEELASLTNRSPLPSAGDYNVIAAVGDRFVTVTNLGEVITAPADGSRWLRTSSVTGLTRTNPAQAIATDGSRTLLTTFGEYHVSDDLETWSDSTRFEFGTGVGLGAAYGGGRFVAVGRSGAIGWSSDATTWTEASTVPTTNNLAGVAYGNGAFVAGGAGGQLLRSTDGDSWTVTLDGIPDDGQFESVSFANGLFLAGATGVLYTSTDGSTWTARDFSSSDVSGAPISVVHDGTRFVISTSFGGSTATADFTTYTEITRGNFARIGPLAVLGNTVATSGIFSAYIGTLTSSENAWVDRSQRIGNDFSSVVFAAGTFITAENSTGRIYTSTTGRVWTLAFQLSDGDGFTSEIATDGGRIAILGFSGGGPVLITSTDATTWSPRDLDEITSNSADLRFINDRFTIFGRNGSLYSSADGSAFTRATINENFWPLDIAFGGGTYVAVGNDGDIITSTDFVTWTPRTSGVEGTRRLISVEHASGRFIAFGSSFSTPIVSADGITWTPEGGSVFAQGSGTDPDLGVFLFGSQGSFRHFEDPSDLTTNTVAPFPSALRASGIAGGNGVTVLVGEAGLILSTAGESVGYQGWVLNNFPLGAANTAPADDFDSDGQPNLAEFARGTDPTEVTPNFLMQPALTAFGPEITFSQRSGDFGFATTVEFSSTLVPGSWSDIGVLLDTSTSGNTETITARVTGRDQSDPGPFTCASAGHSNKDYQNSKRPKSQCYKEPFNLSSCR